MRYFIRPLLWALVILVLCLIPGRQLPQWDWFDLFDLDKLVHGAMFFVQALLLAQGLKRQGREPRYLLWACGISVAYGVFTEGMQWLEALGRRTDINDIIANTIGAVSAGGFASWREKKDLPIVPFAFLR